MKKKKRSGLKVIECIPYKDFKDKMRITKALDGKGRIEMWNGWIYFERWAYYDERVI